MQLVAVIFFALLSTTRTVGDEGTSVVNGLLSKG